MNRRGLIVALVAAAAVGWLARAGIAEEEKKDPEIEGIKKLIEMNKPGEMQALIKKMAGDFDVTGTTVMPTGTVTTKGTSRGEMILGGRYLKQDFSGEFIGMKMDGLALMAHDNGRGKFQSLWIDTWSSGIYTAEGTLGEDGKTITMLGVWKGPEGNFHSKDVYTITDDNSYKLESYMKAGEEWIKRVTMEMTRCKGGFAAGCIKKATEEK